MDWVLIIQGIIIGILGGAGAGICIWSLSLKREIWVERREKERVYKWLLENYGPGTQFKDGRTTRAIASKNNLTKDRAEYICSIDERIAWSTGKTEDLWFIKGSAEESNLQ